MTVIPVVVLLAAAALSGAEIPSEAVTGLVDRIQSYDDQAHIAACLDALADLRLPAADRALTALLADPRPFVRGEAALRLGRRKCRCAVGPLTRLLGDPSVFYVQIDRKHPAGEASVGAAARLALRRITGVPHGVEADSYAFLPGARLVPLYETWWRARGSSLGCN